MLRSSSIYVGPSWFHRTDFSDDDDEVQKLDFICRKVAEHLFCSRISKVDASSVFVGGVGGGIVAEQHYDLDAAANARNVVSAIPCW